MLSTGVTIATTRKTLCTIQNHTATLLVKSLGVGVIIKCTIKRRVSTERSMFNTVEKLRLWYIYIMHANNLSLVSFGF